MLYVSRHELIGSGMIRFVHRWVPESSDPWATLSILHGLGDHGARFDRAARWLTRHGIAVVACDLIGHGRSFGWRGCIKSFQHLMEEVHCAGTLSIPGMHDLPRFVLGHSMGGNLALNWMLRRPGFCHGLVLLAPMLRPVQSIPPRVLRAGRTASRWIPHWTVRLPKQLEALTKDRSAIDAYQKDPWVHRRVSVRLGTELLHSGEWILENAHRIRKPCFIIHGSSDVLASPDASRDLARGNALVSLHCVRGLRHDIPNETEWQPMFDSVRRWMAHQVTETTRPMAA
jgi:alpha-beta hydrolase superfamily lysophospholipase